MNGLGKQHSELSSAVWLISATECERRHADDLMRVADELLRLNIQIERRNDGIGIVGSRHTEPCSPHRDSP